MTDQRRTYTRWTDAEKDAAVSLWRRLGSVRLASAETGISIGTIRGHAAARAGDVDLEVLELAVKILDGLDIGPMLRPGTDPAEAGASWVALVDQVRSLR